MGKLKELPVFNRPEGEELEVFREKLKILETTDAERYVGEEPLDAVKIYEELLEDYENAFAKYHEKRAKLAGRITKLENNEFNAPSFQFTDGNKSRCYALIVFKEEEIYEKLHEGDYVEIIGNIVFIREPYGLVVKKCELLDYHS